MSTFEDDKEMIRRLADELTENDKVYLDMKLMPAGKDHKYKLVVLTIEKAQRKLDEADAVVEAPQVQLDTGREFWEEDDDGKGA
jgi:hypothetical protein